MTTETPVTAEAPMSELQFSYVEPDPDTLALLRGLADFDIPALVLDGEGAILVNSSIVLNGTGISGRNSGPSDEQVARICHAVNKEWCAFNGDLSQKPWDEAPKWQRESAIKGVAFHRANPDAGDSASHDAWMKDKVDAGWVHGTTKDEEAKTHYCIVPFDQLPPEQQFKDRLFRTIVHAAVGA